jgi:hypothetical protein
MDCPAGTVMSRLYRGRKILQGLLYDYAVEQGIIGANSGNPERVPGPSTSNVADAQTLDLDAFRRQRQSRGGTGGGET